MERGEREFAAVRDMCAATAGAAGLPRGDKPGPNLPVSREACCERHAGHRNRTKVSDTRRRQQEPLWRRRRASGRLRELLAHGGLRRCSRRPEAHRKGLAWARDERRRSAAHWWTSFSPLLLRWMTRCRSPLNNRGLQATYADLDRRVRSGAGGTTAQPGFSFARLRRATRSNRAHVHVDF